MKKVDEIDILKRNVKDLQGQLTDAYKKIHELQNKKSYHTIIETKTHMSIVSFYDALGCIRIVAQVLVLRAKPNFFNSS